jgi:hypothetical protein
MRHASDRPDQQNGEKSTTSGPPGFSHAVLYEMETIKVNNIERSTGLSNLLPFQRLGRNSTLVQP